MKKDATKQTLLKTAYLGMFLALAMIFSYLETLIPVIVAVPGIKLGLANGLILIILYLYGPREAAVVSICRVVLSALMFSGLYALMYSAAGAVLSLLVMSLFYKKENVFSSIGIGMLGGVAHNMAQIAIAFFVTKTAGLAYYIPVLIVSGMLTGGLTGFLSKLVLGYLKKLKTTKEEFR
jgi:heptaprenyl diphosphate synthase